jgi:hypothetical protein
MGMGTKFYSIFSDGTMIISSDFMSRAVPSPESKINRLGPHSTLEQTWSFHKAEVLRRSRAMEFLSERMTFGDYVLMSAFEEDPSQYVFS